MRRGMKNSSAKRSNKSEPRHSGKGQVRIIAGQWRGRKLAIPDVEGLRPTPDRIRETLFNWLSPVIVAADCLDLYCGSGALGFEAASRGAKQVSMIDSSAEVISQLKANINILSSNNIHCKQKNVTQFLDGPSAAQDIVFIDPPFGKDLVEPTISKLDSNGWLKFNSYIYIETEANLVELKVPSSWVLHREKKAGEVLSRLFIANPKD